MITPTIDLSKKNKFSIWVHLLRTPTRMGVHLSWYTLMMDLSDCHSSLWTHRWWTSMMIVCFPWQILMTDLNDDRLSLWSPRLWTSTIIVCFLKHTGYGPQLWLFVSPITPVTDLNKKNKFSIWLRWRWSFLSLSAQMTDLSDDHSSLWMSRWQTSKKKNKFSMWSPRWWAPTTIVLFKNPGDKSH